MGSPTSTTSAGWRSSTWLSAAAVRSSSQTLAETRTVPGKSVMAAAAQSIAAMEPLVSAAPRPQRRPS